MRRPPPSPRPSRRAARLAPAALLLASCAGLESERHLAPLVSTLSRAGGGTELEALGGAVRTRHRWPGGPREEWALRPLVIHEFLEGESSRTLFLTPLGRRRDRGDDLLFQLLPIWRYQRARTPDGGWQWQLVSLPGFFVSGFPDGRIVRAWFPFGGVIEKMFTFDRVEFVLWPLYTRTYRGERATTHVLFPFFAWTEGPGETFWRVWPLVGHNQRHGSWNRWWFLWPVFHWQLNRIDRPPFERREERKWAVWPLYGHTRAGSYRAHAFLWPFFGWAHDPETGFWAWDVPWPLVRLRSGGKLDVERWRAWPAYSYYRGDGLRSTYVGWPVFGWREAWYHDGVATSQYLIPFYQNRVRDYDEGPDKLYRKVWPFAQLERQGDWERAAVPALNPLWRTPDMDRMYNWIWELYAEERTSATLSQRSWLGLFRREVDRDEDRAALSFLWARRIYRRGADEVRETSLLFGLLRWRSGPDGFETLLPPALPGPGWPLERAPAAVPLERVGARRERAGDGSPEPRRSE